MPCGEISRILIVDDEPSLRELLSDVLAGPDIEIATASSGDEARQLADRFDPHLVVADMFLGDCTGIDVIDALRDSRGDIPAVVITGSGDAEALSQASSRRPVELMTKPLDIDRLQHTIRQELARRVNAERRMTRQERLRKLAKDANADRRTIRRRLDRKCEQLTSAYGNLSSQMALQKVVMEYQNQLIGAKSDDDVFRALFRLYVRRTGGLYGVAMVCDSNAQLNVIGRFGVPYPDKVEFCKSLTEPLIDRILTTPQCMLLDAGDESEMFDESIQRYLPGLSVLLLPLIPAPGELIGLVALYRKGEQPFTEGDVAIAEMISTPTAMAIRRND